MRHFQPRRHTRTLARGLARAAPNPSIEQPLGDGGEGLHEWAFGLAGWRARHGLPGGDVGDDDHVVRESVEATGAYIMGRRMFSGGEGPWETDPVASGWWETTRRSACPCSS